MKARFFTKGLAVLAGAALVFILSLQGCSTKPTEAPSTTVITGTAQLSVSSGDNRDSYSFVSGGINYGKLTLVYYTPTVLGMEAVGIMAAPAPPPPTPGTAPRPPSRWGKAISSRPTMRFIMPGSP